MKRLIMASSFGVSALVTLIGSAAVVRDAATESFSGVSGMSGAHHQQVVIEAEYLGMRRLGVHEYDGRACVIEVGQAGLNGGGASTIAGTLKLCEQQSSEAWQSLDVGTGLFVTGIEVCTDNPDAGQARLRGLRVQSASIAPNGSLKPAKKKTEVVFAGCKHWHSGKSCPKGSIATGLRASFGDPAQGYTGLELRCHGLKQTSAPNADH